MIKIVICARCESIGYTKHLGLLGYALGEMRRTEIDISYQVRKTRKTI